MTILSRAESLSRFSAYLVLSTARDKLRALPVRHLNEFADAMSLLEEAIPAANDTATAEHAIELCKQAFYRFNKDVAERQVAGDRLPLAISEGVQIVRGALYYADVELRSALAESVKSKTLLSRENRKAAVSSSYCRT